MPTHDETSAFLRAYGKLTPQEQAAFRVVVGQLVEDLRTSGRPRPSLRVKRVRGSVGVWEMTWAPDGRATFLYGREVRPGEAHILWQAIGGHEIFGR